MVSDTRLVYLVSRGRLVYLWRCLVDVSVWCLVKGGVSVISGSMLVYLWCMVVYWCMVVVSGRRWL